MNIKFQLDSGVWRVDHVKNTITPSFVINGQYGHIILLRYHINGFGLCFTGLTFYIYGLQYHLFYAINNSPMTWSKSVSFHSFISSCHWAMSRSAESRCTWTTINDITWRSNRFSVRVAFKMDALKLYGKRFLVDVLSQLESYNVRYNQFNNTTFRLDWFLGVLDRFSPTNLEDKVIIDAWLPNSNKY